MEITSKRHPYKFYLNLFFWIAFFLTFAFYIINKPEFYNSNIWVFLILVLPAYIIISYLINAPNIILNKKGLVRNNKFYSWEDLSNHKLTGKKNLAVSSEECASLTFKNQKTIYIFDDFYSNSSEMKCFIQNIVIDKKDKIEINKRPILSHNTNKETFIPYKGNPIFTFRGFTIWFPFLFLIGVSIINLKIYSSKTFIACSIITLFLALVFSWMLYYFEISKNFLVVKNHYYFWKKDIYHFSEIKEIIFEGVDGKRPKSLVIITLDFKTKRYYAGSLTDKTWLELQTELENKNIIVR